MRAGDLRPEDVGESTIASHLYTAGMPDPDLLVRTAGEMRISNYLLWQISYAELFVSPVLWPDFGVADLHDAIRALRRPQPPLRRARPLEHAAADGLMVPIRLTAKVAKHAKKLAA